MRRPPSCRSCGSPGDRAPGKRPAPAFAGSATNVSLATARKSCSNRSCTTAVHGQRMHSCNSARLKVEVCEDGVDAVLLPPLQVRLRSSGHMPDSTIAGKTQQEATPAAPAAPRATAGCSLSLGQAMHDRSRSFPNMQQRHRQGPAIDQAWHVRKPSACAPGTWPARASGRAGGRAGSGASSSGLRRGRVGMSGVLGRAQRMTLLAGPLLASMLHQSARA